MHHYSCSKCDSTIYPNHTPIVEQCEVSLHSYTKPNKTCVEQRLDYVCDAMVNIIE